MEWNHDSALFQFHVGIEWGCVPTWVFERWSESDDSVDGGVVEVRESEESMSYKATLRASVCVCVCVFIAVHTVQQKLF